MVNAPPDVRFSKLFRLYLAAVVLVAVGAFMAAAGDPRPVPLLTLGTVLLFMVLGELGAVPLPGGGYVSAGAIVDLACLPVIGPFPTAALSAAATLLTQGLIQRRSLMRVVHNVAIFALTVFAAGAAFVGAGGRIGSLALPADLPALLACGLVYFLCNSILVSTTIGLTAGPNPWRVWQRTFLRGILHHLSFIAFGALIAVAYLATGPWSLLLSVIPFLVARLSFKHYVEITTDLKEFVRALAGVLEEVDPYTRQHSIRVASYAVRLARGLHMSERDIDELEYAALVHDLGKIGPQNQFILQKAGALTRQEQRTLRGHPQAGADIIARIRALRTAADIVRYHHERPDGRGYPYGLLAQDVPFGARILNVADAFDAMTSDRPYRKARGVAEALAELERGAGSQFDHEVVECLVAMHGRGDFPMLPSPSSEELRMLRVAPRGGAS